MADEQVPNMDDGKMCVATGLSPQDQLSAGPIASFQGSLVRNQLETVQKTVAIPYKKPGNVPQWIKYFRDGWTDIGIWKSAFVEFVATSLLCYLSGLIDTTITNFQTSQAAAYAGVSNIFLLTLFIIATAPGSGGHINPMITFATMITGLTGFSRGILYMLAQTLGAGLAGGLLRGAFGPDKSVAFHGGGCFREPDSVTAGEALLIESISSFALLFLAFGVALDPRQQTLFGPLVGPLSVGCSLGLVSFAVAGLAPGYTGASMNPTRCFAFAVARRNFTGKSLPIAMKTYMPGAGLTWNGAFILDQWIWWVGPLCGSFLVAITVYIAPPYHSSSAPGKS